MNPSVAKKASRAVRLLMMVLTAVLIFFFINVMLLVSDIQGTARVVNYAGLVRGTTQRIVKLEDAGQPRDDLLRAVDSYINGLRYGSDDLNLVRLDDDEYQAKMTELANYYDELCAEIIHVREVGYENTDIIAMSEEFFGICDDATGLPNKNKCEEILGQEHPVSAEAPVALCVFDLNNLHTVNNRFGHEKGDEYIRSFAQQLGRVASEACFVGRDGGDEFIAVLWDADRAAVESRLARVRANVNEYSEAHSDMPISYAVGYALSSDFDELPTMRELFSQADKNMYIDKNRIKTAEAAGPQRDGR